jgi:hypothetical protein
MFKKNLAAYAVLVADDTVLPAGQMLCLAPDPKAHHIP